MEKKLDDIYNKLSNITENKEYKRKATYIKIEKQRLIRTILRDLLEPYFGKLDYKFKPKQYSYNDYTIPFLEIKVMIEKEIFNLYTPKELKDLGEFIVHKLNELYSDLAPKRIMCSSDTADLGLKYGLKIKFVPLD